MPPLPDGLAENPRAGFRDPRSYFGASAGHPLELEIGSGKGTFLLRQGAAAPEVNFLGLEYAREFFLYAADRIRRAGLTNIRMAHADAVEFLRWRTPDACLRVIHLYFSDPWPKKRHHKNRVIQDDFLHQAWRTLEDGGELRVVTDHDDLWAWNMQHFTRAVDAGRFRIEPFIPPRGVGEGQAIGTNYETKKCTMTGKTPYAVALRKMQESTAPSVSRT